MRVISSGEERRNRAWLAAMLLLGVLCPGLLHAQFQRLWEINASSMGQFHAGNFYMLTGSNNDRTITLSRLSSHGVLTPLWSYTEPTARFNSALLAVDPLVDRIFLRIAWESAGITIRADLWALSLEGNFHWVTHSTLSGYRQLIGDRRGGVVEKIEQISPFRDTLNWYGIDGNLEWTRTFTASSLVRMDPLNRLLVVQRLTDRNYRGLAVRYEWYTPRGNLVQAVEWRPSDPAIEVIDLEYPMFDEAGAVYQLLSLLHSDIGMFQVVLALSPEGQVRWVKTVPRHHYWIDWYYVPVNHTLLGLYQTAYGKFGLLRLSAQTGAMLDSRIIYEPARPEVDSVHTALDNRFLYVAFNEGHLETDCDYEGCWDYFVLDEAVLVRFTLDGERRAKTSFPAYIHNIELDEGNLWLFFQGATISCFKPLAVWADGDIDVNGCVDEGDLLRLLFAFGQSGMGLPEDVNLDGVVDDADLMRVLSSFGFGC